MHRDEIGRRIKSYLEKEHPQRGAQLTETMDLMEDWFTDSLDVVKAVLFLEKEFGIRLSSGDMNAAAFRNVSTLAELVASRLLRTEG
ncbi:MAG: phosphopantetheine-binding protein [Elusimicrobiota bacterium]